MLNERNLFALNLSFYDLLWRASFNFKVRLCILGKLTIYLQLSVKF